MAIIKSSVKLIIREHAHYHYQEPVLTLGVPEIYATSHEIEKCFSLLPEQSNWGGSEEIQISSNPIGKKLNWVSARTFFRFLGMNDVISIDLPDCEYGPDIIHDLNKPIPPSLVDRFNLVLDPGTIEHVFDIKTGLTNVVRALKIGGVIIHQVPIYSYNGGYFSINPNVLHDYYSANGFNDIKAYIIMWDRYSPYTGKYRCYEYSDTIFGQRHALTDFDQCRFSPCLLFFARKTEKLSEITTPLQFGGQYIPPSSDTRSYEQHPSRIKLVFRRMISLVYKVLPLTTALYIDASLHRFIVLNRTRQHSFWI